MFQDKPTRAIIEFALSQQEPYYALRSLIRAGQLAAVYRPVGNGGVVDSDFTEVFPCSKTRNVAEAACTD
jgi:hypothetical protein